MTRPSNAATIKARPLASKRLPQVARAAIRVRSHPALLQRGDALLERLCTDLSRELKTGLSGAAVLMPRLVASGTAWGAGPVCRLLFVSAVTGDRVLLEVESPLASALVDRLCGGAGAPSLPSALLPAEEAALGFLALLGLEAVRTDSAMEEALAMRLDDFAASAEEARKVLAATTDWLAVEATLGLNGFRGNARLLLPASMLERLAHHIPEPAAAALPARFAGLELPARLRASGIELEPEQLRQLRPGDVVLTPGLLRTADGWSGPAELALSTFVIHGHVETSEFTAASIQDALAPEVVMKANASPPLLPVELKVEFTRLRLPLSSLAQLQKDSVLRLNVTLSDAVLLTVGDTPFARAELVDVEGEVGARVVEILEGGER